MKRHIYGRLIDEDMAIQDAFSNREEQVGFWIAIGHPTSAEITSQFDFDFVVIDGEHTDSSFETIASLVRAVEASSGTAAPLVRVSWNDPAEIKRVLDLGARGILVPMVESAENARDVVDAVRFPPAGHRGVAGSRAAGWGAELDSYLTSANHDLATIAQIESEAGVENAMEIASVDGIHGLFIGPVDLSASLGVYGEWESDRFTAAVETVVRAAHSADISVGTLVGSPDQISSRLEWEVDFMVVGTDKSTLRSGIQTAYTAYEDA